MLAEFTPHRSPNRPIMSLRRWRRAEVLALLLLLLLSGGVGAHATTDSACEALTGRVERHDFYASLVQTRFYYSVYLPPCYDSSDETYPVLYLLHGSNEDDGQWLRLGLAGILDEGIAQRASDIDVVYLAGYGFPAFRGGPMFHADEVGLFKVARSLDRYAAETRPEARRRPAPLLVKLAAAGQTFN